MRCVDTNILVYAHRPDSPHHQAVRAWLDAARIAPEPLGLLSAVTTGFVRVVTHPKVFKEPTPVAIALEFVDALLTSPAVLRVAPDARHWDIFRDLCARTEATGNAVPDASLAATAIELGATWVSCDRGFARFPGLRWEHPLDG